MIHKLYCFFMRENHQSTRCYIFYMNVRGRWERLARGHKIEFVYSNFMGKFRSLEKLSIYLKLYKKRF